MSDFLSRAIRSDDYRFTVMFRDANRVRLTFTPGRRRV